MTTCTTHLYLSIPSSFSLCFTSSEISRHHVLQLSASYSRPSSRLFKTSAMISFTLPGRNDLSNEGIVTFGIPPSTRMLVPAGMAPQAERRSAP